MQDYTSESTEGKFEEKHYALLLRASEILSSSLDIQQILDNLLDQVIAVIQAERAFVMMREDEQGEWQCRSARNINQEVLDQLDFSISRSIINKVQQDGVSISTSNAALDERFSTKKSIQVHNLRSISCVPLIIKNKVLGVIYADNRIRAGVFSKKETELLEAIARHAVIALENAMLYEKLNMKSRGLHYILDNAPAMHIFRDISTLVQSIFEILEDLCPATHSFMAVSPEFFIPYSEFSKSAEQSEDGDSLSIVWGTGRFRHISPADRSTCAQQYLQITDAGITAKEPNATAVPLTIRDRMIGAIYLETDRIASLDGELLHIFAIQVSLAMENCRLFGMATEDNLTKTCVRNFFFRRLEQELYQSLRHRYPLSICIVDLDKFKDINDRFGHPAGDVVLTEVSGILRKNIRFSDFIGRYGGDEFIIAYPYTDTAGARTIARRLLTDMNNYRVSFGAEKLVITYSIGFTVVEKEVLEKVSPFKAREILPRYFERIIKIADEALYQSKREGRNRFSLHMVEDIETMIAQE